MRVIDLFCGCGGLSLGFQNADFEICAAFDNWEPARKVYQKNFSHPIYDFDLSNISDYRLFNQFSPDIIIGGPPCQDYSSAGKRNENLGRANLTLSFANIIYNIRPKWFVMENVELITRSNTLPKAIEIFKNAGYGLSSTVLNASFCGVPQDRKRYFLIGELNGKDEFINGRINKNLSQKQMTVHDYLGDTLGIEYYYRHPRSYQRRAIFSIYEPSPTIRGVNRPIPKTYKKHLSDHDVDIELVRPLTTIERSYIQTFPRDFIFEGSKTVLEQMIGNAVPVKLAEFVAKALRCHIFERTSIEPIVLNDTSFLIEETGQLVMMETTR